MSLKVRLAHPSEAADLSALILLSKQSNGYDDAFMAQCVDDLRVRPEDISNGQIWVATDDTALLGCVTLSAEPGKTLGEITSFFVHPNSKRQGVGRALWNTALTAAQEQGLTHLRLDADPEAVPFYEALGFVTIGQSPSTAIPDRFLPLMELAI